MEIKEYIKTIDETKIYPTSVDNFGLVYTFLGLCEELVELDEAFVEISNDSDERILSEVGDVVWYVTAMCLELKIDAEEVLSYEHEVDYLDNVKYDVFAFSDVNRFREFFKMLKKFYRDNKEIIDDIALAILKALIGDLKIFFKGEFDNILQKNHDKLIRRRENNTISGDGDNR